MKVSDWLQNQEPRGIWDHDELRLLFEQETGKPAPWELNDTCSISQTISNILLFGGEISPALAPSGRTIVMVQVAEAAATKFTPKGWSPKCFGRGSRHRECIARLRAFDQ